jgi:hypothetical protein
VRKFIGALTTRLLVKREMAESAMTDAVPAAVKYLGRYAVPPRFDQPDHCASPPAQAGITATILVGGGIAD